MRCSDAYPVRKGRSSGDEMTHSGDVGGEGAWTSCLRRKERQEQPEARAEVCWQPRSSQLLPLEGAPDPNPKRTRQPCPSPSSKQRDKCTGRLPRVEDARTWLQLQGGDVDVCLKRLHARVTCPPAPMRCQTPSGCWASGGRTELPGAETTAEGRLARRGAGQLHRPAGAGPSLSGAPWVGRNRRGADWGGASQPL